MASFPKIARIRSFPASSLRTGSPSDMNRRYVALRLSRAAASASTPRCASMTSARLMVRRFLLATRSTSIARRAGIVTLWRTDGAVRVRAFGLFLTSLSYHLHHCGAGSAKSRADRRAPGNWPHTAFWAISLVTSLPHVRGPPLGRMPPYPPSSPCQFRSQAEETFFSHQLFPVFSQ